MHTVVIDGGTYILTKAPALAGLKLLRVWCDYEADQQEALAEVTGLTAERIHAGWHTLADTDQARALEHAQGRQAFHRLQAAEYRAASRYLLTDAAIRDLVEPTLCYVSYMDGGAMVEAAETWRGHFAGRLGALIKVLQAARDHNFADFFGASEASPDPEATPGEEPPAQTSTGGSGRPSVRASARSERSSTTGP